jgi:hypothetical protein
LDTALDIALALRVRRFIANDANFLVSALADKRSDFARTFALTADAMRILTAHSADD